MDSMSVDTKIKEIFQFDNQSGWKRKFRLMVRVLYVSCVRFYRDDCLMQASAVSYTTIVSLVPMLTVALAFLTITSGFNESQDQIFEEVNTFLQKNDIKIDIGAYLENLKDIINSATQIGAVGFIVLIFSATAILRSFEASFNKIWRIETPRAFVDKIIFYFFILSIGPLLFAVFLGFAMKSSDRLRPSHLFSVSRDSSNFIWIAGERGTLIKTDDSGKKLSKLSDLKIDYENITCFDMENKVITRTCEVPKLNKEDFIKIRNRNKSIVSISRGGVFLQSFDNSLTWKLTVFQNSSFKDFSIIDENNILILNERGDIFKYSNMEKVEFISLKSSEVKAIATRVRFYDSKLGFILDDSGILWISRDGGTSFQANKVTENRLEDIAIINRDLFILVGEKGGIYKSFDGGKTWKDISHKNITFSKIWNLTDNGTEVLLVLNNLDQILRSTDLGENWAINYTPENGALLGIVPINPRFGFKSLNPEEDETEEAIKEQEILLQNPVKGDILAVGEFGKISIGELKDDKVVFKGISGGEAIFSFYSILRITFPLIAIWLFFLMLYTLIPNTKVPIKAAMIGAIITGVIFLFFLYGFGVYVRSFSGSTFMIYRALAAVPLFLLGVYSVSNIILLGAEITATLQYRDRYLSDNIFKEKSFETNYFFYNSIQLLVLIYKYQKEERSLPSEEKIKYLLEIPAYEFAFIKKKLLKSNLLIVTENGILVPTISSVDLLLNDIHKSVLGEAYSIPQKGNDSTNIKFKNSFSEVDSYIIDKFKGIKINDLL
jgi:membrane protein